MLLIHKEMKALSTLNKCSSVVGRVALRALATQPASGRSTVTPARSEHGRQSQFSEPRAPAPDASGLDPDAIDHYFETGIHSTPG